MRVVRLISLFVMFVLVAGMSPAPPAQSPRDESAQSSNVGVFGFGEEEWTTSGDAQVQAGGPIVITLEDQSVVTVRLDDNGGTAFVGYRLPDPLSFADAERFVIQELLPSDADYLGQYDDILPGEADGAITVRLYQSNELRGYLPDSAGIVLFAWHEDGTAFSVSVGRQD